MFVIFLIRPEMIISFSWLQNNLLLIYYNTVIRLQTYPYNLQFFVLMFNNRAFPTKKTKKSLHALLALPAWQSIARCHINGLVESDGKTMLWETWPKDLTKKNSENRLTSWAQKRPL